MFVCSPHRKPSLPASSRVCFLWVSLIYQKPDSFLVKIYDRIKARVKINIIEEKKGIFGRGKKRYVTKELNIRELTAMTPEEKEAKGVVIQEISMSKLALSGF